MEEKKQPSSKVEKFRVEIRDRNRTRRVNVERSESLKDLTLSESEIATLKSTLNETNLIEHLTSLKYLSLKTDILSEFVSLVSPLMLLAKDTKQDYIYIDAITIIVNMAFCKNFKYDEELALQLSPYLLVKDKETEVMELFSNLLNFGGDKLFAGLVELNILEFLERRQKKLFEDEKKMVAFYDLMFATLANHGLLKEEELKRLIDVVVLSKDTIAAEEIQWQICVKLSRFCHILTAKHAAMLLVGFQQFIEPIFKNKKARAITWISPFLTELAKKPQGFTIFKETHLFNYFLLALETRNPATKQQLITILSSMAGSRQANAQNIFLHIMNMVKSFETFPLPVQLSLAFFMTSTLTNSMDVLILEMLNEFGMLRYIRLMLSSNDVQAINSGLLLLAAVLAVNRNYAKLCQQQNIPVLLVHLQKYPLKDIFQKCCSLIDMYFRGY